MLKNYFKTAIRNFWKSKLTSIINIGSLAVGIACCIIIILFVKNEWTFDQFHAKADRVYRLYTKFDAPGRGNQQSPYTPFNMTRLISEDYEGVEAYSTFSSYPQQVEYKDQSFPETVNVVSKGFFKIFDFPVLSGSTSNAFDNNEDIVITKEMAEKYFGTANATGEELKMTLGEEDKVFRVVAVLDELPSNSSLSFNFLISDENAKLIFPEPVINTWHMIMGTNYVLLKDDVNPDELEAKLPSLVDKVLGTDREGEFSIHFQPLLDIHLNNNMPAGYAVVSDPKYTYILTGIAALILILGCVNFMILSVGKSSARAKEIGVRKAIGASKSQLGGQLIAEGVILALTSLLVALAIVVFILPMFNELASTKLKMTLEPITIGAFVGLAVIIGVVASIYPAFIISSFRTTQVLKGNVEGAGKKHFFKMALVTGQFVLSIFLISTTVLMQKQLNYLQNKNLGFDTDQVISMPLHVPGARGIREQVVKGMEKSQLLVSALASNANVVSSGTTSQTFGNAGWIQLGWNEPETDNIRQFRMNVVDAGYIPTMNMELIEGRNFDKDSESDKRRSIIVNEAFVKEFNLENPIGARIPNPNAIDHEIIGVVKDFHFASLHNKIEPLVLTQNINIPFSSANNISMEADPSPKVLAKIAPNTFDQTLEQIKTEWAKTYGDEPFDFNFMDEGLKTQYEAEQNLSKIVSSATFIAILIGCLGLFSLATLTMNARIKEISVRKVLGAPMKNIIYLLTKSYFGVIVIALIISVPMTLYFAQDWMSEFEYKIEIGADSFLLAGGVTLFIAILTISYQCLKVARANPAETLSAE